MVRMAPVEGVQMSKTFEIEQLCWLHPTASEVQQRDREFQRIVGERQLEALSMPGLMLLTVARWLRVRRFCWRS